MRAIWRLRISSASNAFIERLPGRGATGQNHGDMLWRAGCVNNCLAITPQGRRASESRHIRQAWEFIRCSGDTRDTSGRGNFRIKARPIEFNWSQGEAARAVSAPCVVDQ
jgi:hypothetical protein